MAHNKYKYDCTGEHRKLLSIHMIIKPIPFGFEDIAVSFFTDQHHKKSPFTQNNLKCTQFLIFIFMYKSAFFHKEYSICPSFRSNDLCITMK